MSLNLASEKHPLAASQLQPTTSAHRAVSICALLLFLLSVVIAARPATPPAPTASNVAPGSSGVPSVIVFSPATMTLNNPGNSDGTTSTFVPVTVPLNLSVYDSNGNVMTPTEANPLHVHVYGAPEGVISPIDSVLTSSTSVTFIYNGGAFPNNMEIAAWMDDPSSGGASLGTTLFVKGNRPACSYGSSTYDLKVTSTVPDPIQVKAVVGADNPQPSDFKTFTIDTGSLGVMVTKSSLVMGPNVHGPGAVGQKFYDSSGFIFTGNYYLAPVSVELSDGSFVQSNPILVLAIDGVHCHTGYAKCNNKAKPDLHYLGVGFDRNTTGVGDLFDSPSENAFLNLTDTQNGTDINEGYILSTEGVTLGITAANSRGFNMVTLDPNSTVPGDWNPVHGCYMFPGLTGSPQFCGNLLLDVGISEMFMDLSFDLRPTGSYGSNNRVPDKVEMNIQAGLQDSPALNYSFKAVQPPKQPKGPAPTYAQWYNDSNVFVNTGRRPLMKFNYLYSGQCGQVGFEAKR